MVEHDDDIGFSRSNEVSMSLEDEEAGAEAQEIQVKRRRITGQLGCEQREMKLQISCLPIDVLYCVLDKLLELVDYVRFAAVCKELQQVAKLYNFTKQRWVSKPKLLPMLMLPPNESDNDTKQRLLYSVSERKIYNNINIRLSMPYNENLCGSSQGWLASALQSTGEWPENRIFKLVHEITLRNPFGKASEVIHLPPYMHCIPEIFEHVKEWIPRVILSANPALHPENYYVLFALYRPLPHRIPMPNGVVRRHMNVHNPTLGLLPHRLPNGVVRRNINVYNPTLALFKGGQESWITIDRLDQLFPKFDDAIFYRNKICLLLESRNKLVGSGMVTLDVDSINLTQPKIQYSGFKPEPARNMFHAHCWEQYLVESTNGDLLLVQRFYEFEETSFGVCKIVFNEEDKSPFQLVEVKCIGDDAIFLGQSQSQSVLATSIPGCKPNCIYYATESVRRDEYPKDFSDILKSEMGIFNLGDRTRTTLIASDSISHWNWNVMNMPFWVLPSLNI
ncbi:hypothetical protein ACLB2K_002907 [Fragaria x ananassa]